MDTKLLFGGFISGLLIAAPLGPLGLLCVHRTLGRGRTAGFISGLGIATADAIYGGLAGLGVAFIDDILTSHGVWFRLFAAIAFCYFGFRLIFSKTLGGKIAKRSNDGARFYFSTFIFTLTNPTTILGFIAIFAILGVVRGGMNILSFVSLVAGVFGGSAAWWFILTGIISAFRKKLVPHTLCKINRILGGTILGLSVLAFFIVK